MLRRFDITAVLFLALNALYWLILARINNAASPYVYFAVPAVFIVPPAMYLHFAPAAAVVAAAALAVSAGSPASQFAVCAVWIGAAMLVNAWRFKLRGGGALSDIALALLVNFAVCVLCAPLMPFGCENFSEYAARFGADMAASCALLCVCARFCMALPVSIMGFFGVDITMSEDI